MAYLYLKDKGDYDSLAAAFRKIYQGKKGYETDFESKLVREIVAELIGEYVFTDGDFVNNLSTKHRNVFQKLYDEVKYLVKVATAGSKEARPPEKVKKLFDEAYRNTKNTAQPDGVKHSVFDSRITAESTEQERYEILKDAEISVAEVKADIIQDIDLAAYNTRKKVRLFRAFKNWQSA